MKPILSYLYAKKSTSPTKIVKEVLPHKCYAVRNYNTIYFRTVNPFLNQAPASASLARPSAPARPALSPSCGGTM